MYAFYNSHSPSVLTVGPHYDTHAKACGGRRQIFDREYLELYAKCLSKTKANKLLRLKPGGTVRLDKVSLNCHLCVIRFQDDNTSELFQKIQDIQNNISAVHRKIKEKCVKEYKEWSTLTKEFRQIKKHISQKGFRV